MSEIPGRADTLCPTRNPPVFCRHEETCRSFDCTRLASEKDERICYLYAAYNNVLTVGVSNPLKSAEKKIRREIPLSPCGRRWRGRSPRRMRGLSPRIETPHPILAARGSPFSHKGRRKKCPTPPSPRPLYRTPPYRRCRRDRGCVACVRRGCARSRPRLRQPPASRRGAPASSPPTRSCRSG